MSRDKVIVGAQWGDEGKGKIIDMLSGQYSAIARFQGGSNAGHTLVINDVKTVLHQIPSGIMTPDKVCVIGNGCVIDPVALINEMKLLRLAGIVINPERLMISSNASIVLKCHMMLDRARDKTQQIGTTGRGIGPAYEDLANRSAARMGDLRNREVLFSKVNRILIERNMLLLGYNAEPVNIHDEMRVLDACAELIPYLRDVGHELTNHSVLFEGAQGVMLDVQHGTTPFVTSSQTVAASAAIGTGVSHHRLKHVMGVTKAYTTRVGSGPLPTEQDNEIGEYIRQHGSEFGATTGRPRRCGWLDLPVLRYTARVSGITEFAVTKLDTLRGLHEIKVCTHYVNTKTEEKYLEFPADNDNMGDIRPAYIEYPGYDCDLNENMHVADMPLACKSIIQDISNIAPVTIVSIGPGRDQYLRNHTIRDIWR